jgi:hypothetical protein
MPQIKKKMTITIEVFDEDANFCSTYCLFLNRGDKFGRLFCGLFRKQLSAEINRRDDPLRCTECLKSFHRPKDKKT